MNLCRRIYRTAMLAMFAVSPMSASSVIADDLRDATPVDSCIAVWGTQNPERDYMQGHQQAVFDEMEKSKIFEKFLHILQSHLSERRCSTIPDDQVGSSGRHGANGME